MGDGYATGEKMEPRLPYFIQVPDRTVRTRPHTPQSLVDIAVHFPPKGPYHGMIDIVDHGHSGRWNFLHLRPPFRRLNSPALGRVSGNNGCDRITDHGPQIGKNAFYLRVHESFVPRYDVEEFNGICNGAGRPAAQRLQFFNIKPRN